MAINFPDSPANGAVHTVGGVTWTYSTSLSSWRTTSVTNPSVSPGGSNTHVLFNDSNTVSGNAGFVFDKSANNVTIANTVTVKNIVANGTFTANGGVGSAGQLLTSGGAGANAYWSTVAGGSLPTTISIQNTTGSAYAPGSNAFAIGVSANAAGINAYAIGTTANAVSENAIAIGAAAKAASGNNIAIGFDSIVSGNQSIAIGLATRVSNQYSVAIGPTAKTANGSFATAVGAGAVANASAAVALGYAANVATGADYGVAIGYNATATVANTIVLGPATHTTIVSGTLQLNSGVTANSGTGSAGQVLTSGGSGANAYWSTVSGGGGSLPTTISLQNTTATATGSGANSIAIGANAQSTANISIAIGANTMATGTNSHSFGHGTTVSANNSFAFGPNNTVSAIFAGAIGKDITNSTANTIVIGSSQQSVIVGTLFANTAATVNGALTANSVIVNGSLIATTKSFDIVHPLDPNKRLRYGSLEGPENGVYVRGRLTDQDTIILPDYWENLVAANSVTVHLTSIGAPQHLYVISSNNTTVVIGSQSNTDIDCYYTITGERQDIDPLVVEY